MELKQHSEISPLQSYEECLMLTDRESRFLEAGLLLAVPISVAVAALIAVFALARF
jgi:hypothetical protein